MAWSAVSFDESGSETRTCIDGKQRLTSMRRFTQKRFWYKQGLDAKKQQLPKQYIQNFANKQIVCMEYEGLTKEQEREIFQSNVTFEMDIVLIYMTLLCFAERMQAISGPWPDLVRKIQSEVLGQDGFGDQLDWGRTRGRDFQCLASIICLIDRHPSASFPTAPQLDKWLQQQGPVPVKLSNDILETFKIFLKLVRNDKYNTCFQKPRVSPVEFTMTGVLIHRHKAEFSMTRLSSAIAKMRANVRSMHNDVRANGRVTKTMFAFIGQVRDKELGVDGKGDDSPAASSIKGVATGKSGKRKRAEVESEEEDKPLRQSKAAAQSKAVTASKNKSKPAAKASSSKEAVSSGKATPKTPASKAPPKRSTATLPRPDSATSSPKVKTAPSSPVIPQQVSTPTVPILSPPVSRRHTSPQPEAMLIDQPQVSVPELKATSLAVEAGANSAPIKSEPGSEMGNGRRSSTDRLAAIRNAKFARQSPTLPADPGGSVSSPLAQQVPSQPPPAVQVRPQLPPINTASGSYHTPQPVHERPGASPLTRGDTIILPDGKVLDQASIHEILVQHGLPVGTGLSQTLQSLQIGIRSPSEIVSNNPNLNCAVISDPRRRTSTGFSPLHSRSPSVASTHQQFNHGQQQSPHTPLPLPLQSPALPLPSKPLPQQPFPLPLKAESVNVSLQGQSPIIPRAPRALLANLGDPHHLNQTLNGRDSVLVQPSSNAVQNPPVCPALPVKPTVPLGTLPYSRITTVGPMSQPDMVRAPPDSQSHSQRSRSREHAGSREQEREWDRDRYREDRRYESSDRGWARGRGFRGRPYRGRGYHREYSYNRDYDGRNLYE
ncbi:hypothetical protein PHLCEN_2v5484 [Hermanssonia centrifuga]|uniref:DUF262 domain-containing protein n=1 Tax=Hermanssonia centrifuga TaxID=98765 RepID=A0A2R6P269_9APHY|nr:hypothetical protein PHLCEN_2v5484 [Hermanssonia centrifuga]